MQIMHRSILTDNELQVVFSGNCRLVEYSVNLGKDIGRECF